MDEITLKRTGQSSLVFSGETLAQSEGKWTRGKENNRWYDLALYRTEKGKYVVSVEYQTQWQGELERNYVVVVETPQEVAGALTAYDPTGHVRGYPPGEQYAEKQARLLADLRDRYAAQVSEILEERPEFAERIE